MSGVAPNMHLPRSTGGLGQDSVRQGNHENWAWKHQNSFGIQSRARRDAVALLHNYGCNIAKSHVWLMKS
jgi:hypothetical protein